MENDIIIKIEKLVKEYGDGDNKLLAVNNIDLEVRRGEFVAITGESGSGKTTLLNCLGSLADVSGDCHLTKFSILFFCRFNVNVLNLASRQ